MDKASKRKLTGSTKENIISAVIRLLLKKGSAHSTSIVEIASNAKITRPTLYHCFENKKDLLLAVYRKSIDSTLKPYLETAASIDEPLRRLRYMICFFLGEIICRRPELRILIHDSSVMKDCRFREVREIWRSHYHLLRDTIAELQQKGLIGPETKASWAAAFILGELTWVTYWFDYSRKGDTKAIVATAERMILHQLELKTQIELHEGHTHGPHG